MGLRSGLPHLGSPRRGVADLAAPIQLAPAAQQSKIKSAHQPPRSYRGQPVEAPHLAVGTAARLPRGGRSEEGYGATVERRGRENQCATPYREYAALIWTRSADSHPGPRHETRRIRGRTHVSTRRRAAPRTTILLAPKGASTHVQHRTSSTRL